MSKTILQKQKFCEEQILKRQKKYEDKKKENIKKFTNNPYFNTLCLKLRSESKTEQDIPIEEIFNLWLDISKTDKKFLEKIYNIKNKDLPEHSDFCLCGHVIKNNNLIYNKDLKKILVVGSCCVKKFIKEVQLKCENCNIFFKTRRKINIHLCDICNNNFKHNYDLKKYKKQFDVNLKEDDKIKYYLENNIFILDIDLSDDNNEFNYEKYIFKTVKKLLLERFKKDSFFYMSSFYETHNKRYKIKYYDNNDLKTTYLNLSSFSKNNKIFFKKFIKINYKKVLEYEKKYDDRPEEIIFKYSFLISYFFFNVLCAYLTKLYLNKQNDLIENDNDDIEYEIEVEKDVTNFKLDFNKLINDSVFLNCCEKFNKKEKLNFYNLLI